MRHNRLPGTRALLYIGGALAVLACAALYAVPGQPPAAQPPAAQTVAATQAPPAVPNVNGLMVFPNVRVENAPAPADQAAPAPGFKAAIDPATGQLRDLTAAEVRELELQKAVSVRSTKRAITAPTALEGPMGSITMVLGDDTMVETVATIDADGKLSVSHATGPKEAAAKMKASAKAGKEAGNDR